MVGPAATGGRITAGPRLPCSVGSSKRLLALHLVRDLAGRTTSGTRVLRPLAAVARRKSGSPRARVDPLSGTLSTSRATLDRRLSAFMHFGPPSPSSLSVGVYTPDGGEDRPLRPRSPSGYLP
jgi:hypothetical protein